MLIPKYVIGDKVWCDNINRQAFKHECPDCKGTGHWSCTTPGGFTFTLPCQRCTQHAYLSDQRLRLDYYRWVPIVTLLTIGSVRTDTAAREGERVSYMCRETGVGSGNIYYEGRLFNTQEEAEVHGRIMAYIENFASCTNPPDAMANWPYSLSGIDQALRKAADADTWDAAYGHQRLRRALEEWTNDEANPWTLEDLKQAIEDEKSLEFRYRDTPPLVELLEAARAYPDLAVILEKIPRYAK